METGLYIYCITPSPENPDFDIPGMGGADSLRAVPFDGIAAVVSPSSLTEYPVNRENVMTHPRVVEAVMQKYPVLPVRFSTIAKEEAKIVKRVLEPRREEFTEMLGWVADKTEAGLKAFWNHMPDVYEEISAIPEMRLLKEELTGTPAVATLSYRVEIGHRVAEELDRKRRAIQAKVLSVLNPLVIDHKLNTIYGDAMILNGAFLISRENEAEFRVRVEELMREYAPAVTFRFQSGIPPFNFVDIHISWED